MTDYDAIIVGGGPAGASCAAFCAAAGVRTLVLERAVFPRDKVCGDGIAPYVLHELASLGLDPVDVVAGSAPIAHRRSCPAWSPAAISSDRFALG